VSVLPSGLSMALGEAIDQSVDWGARGGSVSETPPRSRIPGGRTLFGRSALRRACPNRTVRHASRRRLPCVPLCLGDVVRGQQPLAGPCRAGRSNARRACDSSVTDRAVAAELTEQLPSGDIELLAGAAEAGHQALLDLRARVGSTVLRAAVDFLISYADRPDWLAGVLAGANAAARNRSPLGSESWPTPFNRAGVHNVDERPWAAGPLHDPVEIGREVVRHHWARSGAGFLWRRLAGCWSPALPVPRGGG
jgi:hypothetical protein